MKRHPSRRALLAAFTLIELMIVVALIAVILALAAPSFREMILMQRLRGTNAQLVTDLALARSEAISRGVFVGVHSQAVSGMSCYIIFARTTLAAGPCDCTAAPTSRCPDAATTEIRTVQVPADMVVLLGVQAAPADGFTFDPRTGGIKLTPLDITNNNTSGFQIATYIDTARKLRTAVSLSGRISVCTPSGSGVGGSPC